MSIRLEQPIAGLRFVEREGEKVLQQKIRIEYPQDGKIIIEWRDVPMVEVQDNDK